MKIVITYLYIVLTQSIHWQEESDGSSEDEFEQVWEWHASSQPVSIAWSPSSTLRAAPACLQVAVASADHKVRQISSDLGESNVVQVILFPVLTCSIFNNSNTYF